MIITWSYYTNGNLKIIKYKGKISWISLNISNIPNIKKKYYKLNLKFDHFIILLADFFVSFKKCILNYLQIE